MDKKELNCEILKKDSILNFQIFQTLTVNNRNLEKLNLIGSSILSGQIDNTSFYSASFLSTKFLNVTFINCNLKSTDICSVWANCCEFFKCDFSNSTIKDSTFINCQFDSSVFECISLTGCQFEECIFDGFPIDDSTFSLNSFVRCTIKNTHFSESFFYQIFDNCNFCDVTMDPALLGFNFGFSSQAFSQLTNGNSIQEISADLKNKQLYINAAILHINQIQGCYDIALIACIQAIGQVLQQDILIQGDEIEFIKNITFYLLEHKQLAPISMLQIWQELNSYLTGDISSVSAQQALPHIRGFVYMLYSNFTEFQNNLQQHLEQLPISSDIGNNAELRIIYKEKPQKPLLTYLSQFTRIAGDDYPLPKLIRTEQGSFHEFHNIAVVILPYLQTFFAFLGVITPFIIYKQQTIERQTSEEKEEKADNRNNGTNEIKIIIKEENTKNSLFLPGVNFLTQDTNTVTSNVIKIIESNQTTNNANFHGYNKQNVQSITIYLN